MSISRYRNYFPHFVVVDLVEEELEKQAPLNRAILKGIHQVRNLLYVALGPLWLSIIKLGRRRNSLKGNSSEKSGRNLAFDELENGIDTHPDNNNNLILN